MKSSKLKYIGIAISCLVIALGVYAWQHYHTTEITQEIVMSMCPFTADQIQKVEIYDQELTTFVRKGEEWVNEMEPELEYDQILLDSLVFQTSQLSTTKIIKNVQNLEAYGINEKATQITVYNTLGEEQSYRIGSRIPQENMHYVWDAQKEIMGIVEDIKLASLLIPSKQLIEKTMDFKAFEERTSWTIYKGNNVALEWKKEGEVWKVTTPYQNQYTINNDTGVRYFETLMKVIKESFVGTTEKNVYGLENPLLRIESEGLPVITIGSEINGKYYMTYKTQPYVYTVNKELVEPLKVIDPFEWIDKKIINPEKKLEKIEITIHDQVLVFENERVDPVLEILMNLRYHSSIANATIEQNSPRQAEIKLQLLTKDGQTEVIEFIPYDPSFYLVRKGGNVEFSVERKSLLENITAVQEFGKLHEDKTEIETEIQTEKEKVETEKAKNGLN